MENQTELSPPTIVIPDPADVEKNRFYALLSYFGILIFIPLFFARRSPFVRFHLNQGIPLLIGWIIWIILGWVPIIGGLIGMALAALLLILQVAGILSVLRGKTRKLFLIGKWSFFKDQ